MSRKRNNRGKKGKEITESSSKRKTQESKVISSGAENEAISSDSSKRIKKKKKTIKKSSDTDSNIKSIPREIHPVTLEERRLDSLARLLEGNGVCSAVCFDGEKILISSNALREVKIGGKPNKQIERIKDVMSHFNEIANGKSPNSKKRTELFQNISRQYIQGQMQSAYFDYHNEAVNKLAEEILKLKDSRKARKWSIEVIAEKSGLSIDDPRDGQLMGTANIAIARLATDLKKLERSIQGEKEEKRFNDDILNAFKTNDEGFDIIRDGQENVHAEMRLITRLLKTYKEIEATAAFAPPKIYIGISKLCCLDCSIAVKAVNSSKALNIDEVSEDISTEENIKKIILLESRGGHGLLTKKWKDILPPFLTIGNKNYNKEIHDRYKEIKLQMVSQQKEQGSSDLDQDDKAHQSGSHKLLPSESESNVASGSEKSLDGDAKGKLTKQELIKFIDKGIENGLIDSASLINHILEKIPGKKPNVPIGDIHAKDNAANQYNNPEYKYQSPDIEAIGRNLTKNLDNVVFIGAIGKAAKGTSLDIKTRLEGKRKELQEGKRLVGVYNIGNSHWVALSIELNKDKDSLNIIYKDSYGEKREELEKAITNVYGNDFKYTISQLQPGQKEQEDQVSCGLFALKNMFFLAENGSSNFENLQFYDSQKSGISIASVREDYAIKYIQETYQDIKNNVQIDRQREILRKELEPQVRQIAEIIKENVDFKELFKEVEIRSLAASESIGKDERESTKIISIEGRTDSELGSNYFRIGITSAVKEEDRKPLLQAIQSILGLKEEQITIINNNEMHISQNALVLPILQPYVAEIEQEHSSSPIGGIYDEPSLKSQLKNALKMKEPITSEFIEKIDKTEELRGTFVKIEQIDIEESKSDLLNIIKSSQSALIKNKIKDYNNLIAQEPNERILLNDFIKLCNNIIPEFPPEGNRLLNTYTTVNNEIVTFKDGALEALSKLFNDEEIRNLFNSSISGDRQSPSLGAEADTEASSPIGSQPAEHSDEEMRSVSDSSMKRSEKLHIAREINNLHNFNLVDSLKTTTSSAKLIILNQLIASAAEQATLDIHPDRNSYFSDAPKIVLLSEKNHIADHQVNVGYLAHNIKQDKITPKTVICLERKQDGDNMSMKDVILLAKIIEYNKVNEEKIDLPKILMDKPIYKDAELYLLAKKNGITVIGIEGKELDHSRTSPNYNEAREEFMLKRLTEIVNCDKSIIFMVGSSHVLTLQDKLNKQTKVIIRNIPEDLERISVNSCNANSHVLNQITEQAKDGKILDGLKSVGKDQSQRDHTVHTDKLNFAPKEHSR